MLGAESAHVQERWKSAKVTGLLRFSIDERELSIFRTGSHFAVFDSKQAMIGQFEGATRGLGEFLSGLLGFHLTLTSHDKIVLGPPDVQFLPFYIDQDKGWVGTWCSFKGLQRFKRIKAAAARYFSGIRPPRWYELDANRRAIESRLDEPRREIRAMEQVLSRVRNSTEGVPIHLDVEEYKEEITRLLGECDRLSGKQEKHRRRIAELNVESNRVRAQIEIIERAQIELNHDFAFAADELDDEVACPTCGTVHQNSFADRFSIADDEDKCRGLLTELVENKRRIAKAMEDSTKSLEGDTEELARLENILAEKKGRMTLRDVIRSEGRREVSGEISKELDAQQSIVNDFETKLNLAQSEQDSLVDRIRSKKLLTEYRRKMKSNLLRLNVHSLSEASYKNIDCTINESGSDLPRAILAYFFAIIRMIQANETSALCPIVIDSPNQQEQDDDNYPEILRFIREETHQDAQLILGAVDIRGVEFDGKIIDLDERLFALRLEEYDAVSSEVASFERMALDG